MSVGYVSTTTPRRADRRNSRRWLGVRKSSLYEGAGHFPHPIQFYMENPYRDKIWYRGMADGPRLVRPELLAGGEQRRLIGALDLPVGVGLESSAPRFLKRVAFLIQAPLKLAPIPPNASIVALCQLRSSPRVRSGIIHITAAFPGRFTGKSQCAPRERCRKLQTHRPRRESREFKESAAREFCLAWYFAF
jgi:hypothetical protein